MLQLPHMWVHSPHPRGKHVTNWVSLGSVFPGQVSPARVDTRSSTEPKHLVPVLERGQKGRAARENLCWELLGRIRVSVSAQR